MSFPQEQTQRRPQTMFNDFRYPMPTSDKPVEGAKYPARWTWECGLNGNIYFKVNDGIWGQQDKNAKNKEVELSWADRGAIFGLMEEAITNPSFTKSQYLVKKVQFGQGGRMNDYPSTLATFTIIRDAEGRLLVGYTKGTYKVMFPFTSPFDSVILMASADGGEPVENRGLMSRVYAKAFIDFSKRYLDDYEFNNFKPREKKGENGGNNRGGNGGGNNWSGNNSGNNNGGSNWNGNGGGNNGGGQTRQASTPDFDEDIDF